MESDGTQLMSKAEIDTRAPFRSVKEAVTLFGERVLGSEVYDSKLKEMHDDRTMIMEYGVETLTSNELEKAKHNLQKAREERIQTGTALFSLKQELEQTKMELQQLKICQSNCRRQHHLDVGDIEDIKFVEDSTGLIRQVAETEMTTSSQKVEIEKQKYVTFANPPCVARVVLQDHAHIAAEAVLQRRPSLRKKKKKHFIPLIRGFFSNKRGSSEVALE